MRSRLTWWLLFEPIKNLLHVKIVWGKNLINYSFGLFYHFFLTGSCPSPLFVEDKSNSDKKLMLSPCKACIRLEIGISIRFTLWLSSF